MVSADSPLCASAILVRQQNGLNGRVASVPTSSKSLRVMGGILREPAQSDKSRHCERSEAIHRATSGGMDCFVARAPRNDGIASEAITLVMPGQKRVFALVVPGIHVLSYERKANRGWPGQARP